MQAYRQRSLIDRDDRPAPSLNFTSLK